MDRAHLAQMRNLTPEPSQLSTLRGTSVEARVAWIFQRACGAKKTLCDLRAEILERPGGLCVLNRRNANESVEPTAMPPAGSRASDSGESGPDRLAIAAQPAGDRRDRPSPTLEVMCLHVLLPCEHQPGLPRAIRCLKRYLARHLYRLMEGAMQPA